MASGKKEAVKQKPKKNSTAKAGNRFWILILIAFTFILYGNTLTHNYAVDDKVVIENNQFVQKGVAGIKDILTHDSFDGFIMDQKNVVSGGRYRPFSLVTFAIEISMFGSNHPEKSHFINVILYALAGVTLFLLLKQLLIEKETNYSKLIHLPFSTALLFIAHPIHTEAVANIKGRDEILSTLFSLLSALYFLKYVDEEKKMKNCLIGFIFLFLGLLSKENAITFSVIIPMMIWFFRNITLKDLLVPMLAIFSAAGIFLVLRQAFANSSITAEITEVMNNPFYGMSISQKYATIIFTFGKYLWLLLLPVTLSNNYDPFQITAHAFTDIETILSLLVCVTVLVIACIQLPRKTLLSFSILYFAVTFSVVSNLFFPVGTFMSERFLFMPSVSFCLILAWLITLIPYLKSDNTQIINHTFFQNRILIIVLLIISGSYSTRTISRNTVWKNDFTLFSTDVFNSPNSVRSHYALGGEYLNQAEKKLNGAEKNKDLENAKTEFIKSIKLYPAFALGHFSLGITYFNMNKMVSAKMSFKKSISLDSKNAVAWDNLGRCYIQENKMDSAINFCTKAMQIDSSYFQPYANLGAIYLKKMDIEKAYYYFQKAHTLAPNDAATTKAFEDISAVIQHPN